MATAFAQLKADGIHSVRWWVFPGNPWQVTTDASGVPTGLNPAVYQDFDAALALAQQYDLYYDFVLFSGATAMPAAWETDSSQRSALTSALSPLFAHYAGNPRILSWEIYNEPDLAIWSNQIAQQPVVDTAKALTQAVHQQSPGTLVTIGTGYADGMAMFTGVGLDYYSPHWYDYMSGGTYCMICQDASYYQQLYQSYQHQHQYQRSHPLLLLRSCLRPLLLLRSVLLLKQRRRLSCR